MNMYIDIVIPGISILITIIGLVISILKYRIQSKTEDVSDKVLEEFFIEKKPGKAFTKLLKNSFFKTLKIQNHSNDFPDMLQLNSFIGYSTDDINKEFSKIGDSYEKFIL